MRPKRDKTGFYYEIKITEHYVTVMRQKYSTTCYRSCKGFFTSPLEEKEIRHI